MSVGAEGRAPRLERFRAFLMRLARRYFRDGRVRGFIGPSDVVQQTLFEAHRNLDQFRGRSDRELAGWLRTSLFHNFLDALKALLMPGGKVPRVEQRSDVVEGCVAHHSTPSERAARNERHARLEKAVKQLPEAQRQAVDLHYLQGMSVGKTADLMGRTYAAVAGLLRRAIETLTDELGGSE
jgi:RNA polymerase sigma-70 factor (subfamily 1)